LSIKNKNSKKYKIRQELLNNGGDIKMKKKGSVGWLIFWFLMTGFGAIIYYAIRDWG